jgi:uncharacterized protein (DUF2267 family)
MRQLSLSYDPKEAWAALLSALDDAVTHLGLKEVTYKLDVAKSTLCDAMHDRNDRRWAQEWTLVVLEMLADRYSDTATQLAKAILARQAEVTRRFIVVEDEEVSPEEIAAAQRVLDIAKRRKRAA